MKIKGVKLFVDGSLGARTAALFEDYFDEKGNRGNILFKGREFLNILSKLSEVGIQAAIHAIGDRAIDFTLKSLSRIPGVKRLRHRIEHFELPHKRHIELAGKLGLVISMQPNFIGNWGLRGGMYEKRIGFSRLLMNNPYNEILKKGVKLAFGSDCMPLSPLYGLHWAINAPFSTQRISVLEGLKCYTINSAYAAFDERVKGSIEVGKKADLIALSIDPFKERGRIKDIEVILTIIDGKIEFINKNKF